MYRLATLLTGSPVLATRVIGQVVGVRADLRTFDDAHLDRLTVLRSRELIEADRTSEIVAKGLDPEAARVLASIDGQRREAWIFHRIYQLEPRAIARAMDCSRAAVATHLDMAERTLDPEASEHAAKQLLDYTLRLDVPAFHRERLRRRRVARLVWRIAIIVGVLVLLGVAAYFVDGLVRRAVAPDVAQGVAD